MGEPKVWMSKVLSWMKLLTTRPDLVQDLQDNHSHELPKLSIPSQQPEVGPDLRNKSGRCSIRYPDGSVFHGSLQQGLRTGRGVLHQPSTESSVQGFYHQDCLVGNVLETFKDESRALFFCKRGVKHGIYVRTGGNQTLEEVGWYENDRKHGLWWTRIQGGSYLIKEFKHSVSINPSVFVYPDFEQAIQGDFQESHRLCQGRLASVKEYQMEMGILRPVAMSDLEHILDCSACDEVSICKHRLVADGYESKYVHVKQSLIPDAGQGLFCQRPIRKGQVVAFFSGIKTDAKAVTDQSEYAIHLDASTIIDVPPHLRNLDCYRASLAHKICHSFDNNAKFEFCFHPRFGRIRCAVAVRDIQKDEEITCNYKYKLLKAPDWYKADLQRHLKHKYDMNEENIEQVLKAPE